MTPRKPFRFWQRFQFQIGINFSLFPSGRMTWREWAFDPAAGITVPGQVITSRTKLPESSAWEVDTDSINAVTTDGRTKFISRVLWVHGALRVLGLDVGAGIWWRERKGIE